MKFKVGDMLSYIHVSGKRHVITITDHVAGQYQFTVLRSEWKGFKQSIKNKTKSFVSQRIVEKHYIKINVDYNKFWNKFNESI